GSWSSRRSPGSSRIPWRSWPTPGTTWATSSGSPWRAGPRGSPPAPRPANPLSGRGAPPPPPRSATGRSRSLPPRPRARGPPPAIEPKTVIAIALIGTVINAGSALLFLRDRERDLNVRAAFVHLAADAAISLGVAGAGAVTLVTRWEWLDPVTSLVIGALILT